MAAENPLWGEERIAIEADLKRALEISARFNMGVCAPFFVRSMKPGTSRRTTRP